MQRHGGMPELLKRQIDRLETAIDLSTDWLEIQYLMVELEQLRALYDDAESEDADSEDDDAGSGYAESEEEDDGEEDEVFFGRVIGRRPEGASHWLTPPLRAPNALQASPARFSAPDGGRHSPTGRRSRQGSPSVAQSTSGQQ